MPVKTMLDVLYIGRLSFPKRPLYVCAAYNKYAGQGDMSKNSYLGIFWLICGIRYISRYFVFGLNKVNVTMHI